MTSEQRERKRALDLLWRKNNRDRVYATECRYIENHPEKYEAKKQRDRTRRGTKEGRAHCKETWGIWYAKNADHVKQYKKEKYVVTELQKQLYLRAKARAKQFNIVFSISPEDIAVPSHCPVLGLELTRALGGRTDNSPSLDRLIPEQGYTPENIAVISWRANNLKNNATVDELHALSNWVSKEMGLV